MRIKLHLLFLSAVLLSSLLAFPAYASGTEKAPSLQEGELPNVFSLSDLGYAETLLVGPFDATSLYFSLPANIRLAPGSSLSLKYALAWSGGTFQGYDDYGIGGTLLVYFNGELIDTVILQPGLASEKEIIIPANALNLPDETGRYSLRFFLNAEVNCEIEEVRTTVIVSKTSELNLQYETVVPPADLTIFPRPIFQPDSIIPSSALVVIPDNPETYEVQAALAAMAGLGAVTNGELTTNLITNSDLSQDLVARNHLIFVGTAEKFPNLSAVNFPIPVADRGLGLDGEFTSDGVIEIGLSPWSPAAVVLFVGGNSPDAVVKAGQAFSTGSIVAVEKPNFSLIDTVNPLERVVVQEDQTLKDLGYEDSTLGLYGEDYYSYVFYASPEQSGSDGAYLDLVLSHSDLLDYDQTGVTLLLNDEIIGGIQLTQESPVTERIKLVPGVLRRGFNRLEVVSDILPRFSCYSDDLMSTWVTVSNASMIHMPVAESQLDFGRNDNLFNFPYMFLDNRDLSDLAFILSPNDPVSIKTAAKVAFYIGEMGSIRLANLQVMYADNLVEEDLAGFNILTVGLPSNSPFILSINDKLPAPIKEGTNEAVQPSMLVNYSLLPDTNVGYLQFLPSPWDTENAVMVVSGNTLDGLPMAGAVLLRDDSIAKLLGNFAVVYDDQIVATDTRFGLAKESIISQLPVAVTITPSGTTTVGEPVSTPKIEARPSWVLPLAGVTVFIAFILLIIMLRRESIASKIPRNKKNQVENGTDSLDKIS